MNLGKLAQRYGMRSQDRVTAESRISQAGQPGNSALRFVSLILPPARSRMCWDSILSVAVVWSWPELPQFGVKLSSPAPRPPTTWIWPGKGVFTSGFGWRWGRMHKASTLPANVRHAPNRGSAAQAAVSYAGWHNGGYGYLLRSSMMMAAKLSTATNSRVTVQVGPDGCSGHQEIARWAVRAASTGPPPSSSRFTLPVAVGQSHFSFLPGRA